jgi:ribose transport system substrate-binding protein
MKCQSKLFRAAGSTLFFSLAIMMVSGSHIPRANAAGHKLIAVSVADQKSLFYIAEVDGIRAAAKKAGYQVDVAVAHNNSTLQVKQINDLLVKQPGALIFTSQDTSAAIAGTRAANKADVPVIAVDERPPKGKGKLATYIATNSVKAARQLCTWLFKRMDGKGQLAIIHGVLGSTAEHQRTEGCKQALAKYPKVKVVAQQAANWDQTEAYKAAQNILTAHPQLNAIFGESDAMAMGAAKAAKRAGQTDVMSVGIDGFPTMFAAIRSGLTDATKAQQPYKMGELAVKDAIQIMQGKGGHIPAVQYQKATLITQKNINKYKPAEFYGPKATSMH